VLLAARGVVSRNVHHLEAKGQARGVHHWYTYRLAARVEAGNQGSAYDLLFSIAKAEVTPTRSQTPPVCAPGLPGVCQWCTCHGSGRGTRGWAHLPLTAEEVAALAVDVQRVCTTQRQEVKPTLRFRDTPPTSTSINMALLICTLRGDRSGVPLTFEGSPSLKT